MTYLGNIWFWVVLIAQIMIGYQIARISIKTFDNWCASRVMYDDALWIVLFPWNFKTISADDGDYLFWLIDNSSPRARKAYVCFSIFFWEIVLILNILKILLLFVMGPITVLFYTVLGNSYLSLLGLGEKLKRTRVMFFLSRP